MLEKLKIIVCNHKDLERDPLGYPYLDVCNIDGSKKPSGYSFYDSDARVNISEFNKEYCELSQLYSFWTSGFLSEYFGLCHYRRFFSTENSFDSSVEINFEHYKDYIYKINSVRFFDYDLIVPNPINLGDHSIFSQFQSIHPNLVSIFENSCYIFDNYLGAIDSINWFKNNNLLTPCNMFIGKKEIVDHWCSILFPVLFEVRDQINVKLEGYDLRWAGFISERLFSFYIENIINKNNIKKYPILFLR